MEKPLVCIYDWKPSESYREIPDWIGIKISKHLPSNLDSLDALILHSPPLQKKGFIRLMQQAKSSNFPIIISCSSENYYRATEDIVAAHNLGYPNLYYETTPSGIASRIKKLMQKS